jgi:hypothetical protein
MNAHADPALRAGLLVCRPWRGWTTAAEPPGRPFYVNAFMFAPQPFGWG